MANNWFQFKQFKIIQQYSAMKVSTDACIQGAWTACFVQERCKENIDILDIGTGTGLLSLMLAQALPLASIDAIDRDADAAREAASNFAGSAWQKRLSLQHTSLQEYAPAKKYDLIICNPPFFHRHLQASGASRNIARHDITLTKEDLSAGAAALLKTGGYLSVLFPATEWKQWLDTAARQHLAAHTVLHVLPRAGKPANRIIGIFTATAPEEPSVDSLTVRENAHAYSEAFNRLMQPYYLYL